METARPLDDTVLGLRPARGGRVRRGLRLVRDVVLPGSVFLALLLLWAAATSLLGVREYLLPGPAAVWKSGVDNHEELATALLVTGQEVVIGFAIAGALAVPLGILLGELPVFERLFYPLLVLAQIMPKVAIGPLMIVWFGLGLKSKLIFIVLMSFFPIVLNTMVGTSSASADFQRLARSLGLGRAATLWKVTLPQALPSIFAGLKIGVTLAVIGAIVAEFITAQHGLGNLILVAQGQVDTPLLFASLFVLTAFGLACYGLMALLEWLIAPWYASAGEAST